MTPSDISKTYGITTQAICRNINMGRIKATKNRHRWVIQEEDYKKYLESRYRRRFTIFMDNPNNITPKQCCEILQCSLQRIYYHIRTGHLKATRYKTAWVINMDDVNEYKKLLVPIKNKRTSYMRKYKPFKYTKKT